MDDKIFLNWLDELNENFDVFCSVLWKQWHFKYDPQKNDTPPPAETDAYDSNDYFSTNWWALQTSDTELEEGGIDPETWA